VQLGREYNEILTADEVETVSAQPVAMVRHLSRSQPFLPADHKLVRTQKTNNTNILFYPADLFINAFLYMHTESMHPAFPLHCSEMHFPFRCRSNCL